MSTQAFPLYIHLTLLQVLALLALISCSVAEDDTDDCDSDDNCGLLRSSNAAAGWGIFVTFVAALIEINILINRFLNCGYISVYWIVCIIIVSDCNVMCNWRYTNLLVLRFLW